MLSDPARLDQTKSFRTKLAGNINKYITSRYCPDTVLPSVWNANHSLYAAQIKGAITGTCGNDATRNPSGYFYYE